MSANEIEIPGSSLSLRVFQAKTDLSPVKLAQKIATDGPAFNSVDQEAGFHDIDTDGNVVRGYYSLVVAFKVEHLVENVTTKTLMKRIESCEFMAIDGYMVEWGKPGPMKPLAVALAPITHYAVAPLEWDTPCLQGLERKMTAVSKVDLAQGRDKEVRTAKLSGTLEDYTSSGVVDPGNHQLKGITGLLDSSIGPITVTATSKGALRIGVRKGFIATSDLISWLLCLITGTKPVPAQHVMPMQRPVKEVVASMIDGLGTVTVGQEFGPGQGQELVDAIKKKLGGGKL